MCAFTDKHVQGKRWFYAQPKVSRQYDELRFGGPSGEWVNRRELSIVHALLPPGRRVLDLGCGTGRLASYLHGLGHRVVGVDSSADMIAIARTKPGGREFGLLQGNLFALPIARRSFGAVVALRIAFHFADLRPIVEAACAVLEPGGSLIFDTYNWSPRAWLPIGQATWGDRIYAHPESGVRRVARELGFDVVEAERCFLFSPYIYRRLPLVAVRALHRIEAAVPPGWRARTFWHLKLATTAALAGSPDGRNGETRPGD